MDESKLLEECISVNFTPLEAILLSKTLIVTNTLIEFLKDADCLKVEKITKDNSIVPNSEQTGDILITSALTVMNKVNEKVYENGSKQIGVDVPEQFEEILIVYTTVMQQIAYEFIESLRGK